MTKSATKKKPLLGEFGWLNKVYAVLDVPGAKKLWDKLDDADGPETDEILERLRKIGAMLNSYSYGTDAGFGTIEAGSFDEAKQWLHGEIDKHLKDGAWGWVEDHDGYRYEIGSR